MNILLRMIVLREPCQKVLLARYMQIYILPTDATVVLQEVFTRTVYFIPTFNKKWTQSFFSLSFIKVILDYQHPKQQ